MNGVLLEHGEDCGGVHQFLWFISKVRTFLILISILFTGR